MYLIWWLQGLPIKTEGYVVFLLQYLLYKAFKARNLDFYICEYLQYG